MSEDFSDDFVIEEEEENEGSNRSFLITAGGLIGVFIILAGCLLTYVLVQQQRDSRQSEIDERVSVNATTEANNQIVEATSQAIEEQNRIAEASALATREAEATRDAEIAALPPTSTPEPEGPDAADLAATAAANALATTVAEQAQENAAATATAEALAGVGDGSGTGDGSNGTGGNDGNGSGLDTGSAGDGATTLPETGVEVWLISIVAFGMIALLVVSRRLRTSN